MSGLETRIAAPSDAMRQNTVAEPAGSTNARFGMLALISGAVAINYLDRALLGIAAPLIEAALHLSDVQLGWLLSAFSWTYCLSQVPAGILLDKYSVRTMYLVTLLAWSGVTLLHSLASGFAMLIALRLALGIAEAPCFPANNKAVSVWFPRAERAGRSRCTRPPNT